MPASRRAPDRARNTVLTKTSASNPVTSPQMLRQPRISDCKRCKIRAFMDGN